MNAATAQRIKRARAALKTVENNGDFDDNLTDVLANLLHLAKDQGLDFNASLSRARTHFEAEQ